MKKNLLFLTLSLIGLVFLLPSLPATAQSTPPTETEIADFLNALPQIADSGGQVLAVTYVGEALVIDLSREVLPDGAYDDALFAELQSKLDAAFQVNQFFMVTFKVEGLPLEDWGMPLPDFSETAEWPLDRELPGDGPLAGYKIALSAGHGLYFNEYYSEWMYQRGEFWGIREDTVNSEIMQYLKAELENQGATVIDTREMDQNARTGITGYPAWHEDARQFGIYLGLPKWVWDGSNSNYNSDIRARPYMANYYGADLLISFHNNGWDGTLRGTETYWDSNNNAGSHDLAIAVHNQIIYAMTNAYGSWTNRGIIKVDNDYGEINYATMPAILVELAFMDNYNDNQLLHQESFKLLAANSMAEGICTYLQVDCESTPTQMPITLETPTLTPTFGSGMCDSGWYRYTNQRGEYAYLALNAEEEAQSDNVASWTPALPSSGEYRLEVFIPSHNAISWSCPSQTVNWDTSYAAYTITHANGTSTVLVNQAGVNDGWVNLGIFHFDADTTASITLSD
ncbi:MAG: N-acetylmuramoyl-L-alanine amidase, partial [Anaerolineaceae bacterium]|nr:N-acetylmuramoyl-L-alanine amidase [Anaerolineaceae bacterium]